MAAAAAALVGAGSMIAAPSWAEQPVTKDAPQDSEEASPQGCPLAPAGMSCVPAGSFVRGHADAGEPNTRPAMAVEMSTYFMDVHEVTWAAWRRCVKAGRCPKLAPKYRGFDADAQPVSGVDWFQARDYCAAQGKHLPTEAEWEKAARGPAGQLNPWGDAPVTCERSVIMDERGRACGIPKPGTKPEVGQIQPVGSRPAGRYGLFDMSGNVQEWVADWHSKDWAACGAACAGPDPKGPCGGADVCKGHRERVLRGGSWYWPAEHATGLHRRANEPDFKKVYHHFGFRCAASVDEASQLNKRVKG